jgi:hypothetical protein
VSETARAGLVAFGVRRAIQVKKANPRLRADMNFVKILEGAFFCEAKHQEPASRVPKRSRRNAYKSKNGV